MTSFLAAVQVSSDREEIVASTMYEAAFQSAMRAQLEDADVAANMGSDGAPEENDFYGSFSSFFQHTAEDDFHFGERLRGHFGQLNKSKYLISLTCSFFAILFLTGVFACWRKFVRPRLFNVKQHHPADRTNTQLAFRFSVGGFLLYLLWVLYSVFLYTTVVFLIIIYSGGAKGQNAFHVWVEKLVLVCEDGGDEAGNATGNNAPAAQQAGSPPSSSTSTGSSFYSFHCSGWNLRRPDNVNARLQTGFAFLYCWILLTILMAFFYFADLYYMLCFAEVADLADADTIGFSEDVWEQEESAFHTGEAGMESMPQTRKQHERALTSRNLQPIQYVAIETERTSASMDKELRNVYDFDMQVGGESDMDGAAPGETGGNFIRRSVAPGGPLGSSSEQQGAYASGESQEVNLKIFRFKCLKYVYDEDQRMFVARKERLDHLSMSQLLSRFFHGHDRAGGTAQNRDNASVRLGLGTLTYDRVNTLQSHFGKNTIEPHEDKTFVYCMVQEFTTSFMYVFQVQAALLFIFLDAFYITLIFETLYLISGTMNAYYEYRNWHRILDMSRSNSRVKVWRNGYSAQTTQPKFYEMGSEELLPGDVLEVTDGMVLPCEAMLVYGSLLMDESSLTGESTPMEKEVAESNGPRRALDPNKDKTHMLFAGTEVIAVFAKGGAASSSVAGNSSTATASSEIAGSFSEQRVYAVVTGIGTGTMKGDLIRTMFYPLQLFFEFDFELRQAWTYLAFLQPLVLLLLIVTTEPYRDDEHFETIIGVLITGFTSFAQLVNPMIPTMQARASESASRRLEAKGIGCVEPKKIAQAGKVNLFCFDKTGTLTKEGMDFYGVCVNKGEKGELANRFAATRMSAVLEETHITGAAAGASPLQPIPGRPLHGEGSDVDAASVSGAESGRTLSDVGGPAKRPVTSISHIMNEMRTRTSLVSGDQALPHVQENFDEVAYESIQQFHNTMVNTKQDSTLFALACCHSLSVGPDGSSIIGNPLEKEALKSVGWSLQRPSAGASGPSSSSSGQNLNHLLVRGPQGSGQEALILRKWKFDQSRQLQITICCTENLKNPDMSKVTVFAKGSMEAVTKLAKNEHDKKISDLTTLYASRGFYVLGLCQAEWRMNWGDIEGVSMDDVLANARFEYQAMALFRNELRPESFYVIKELKAANVHTVMITGDSVYTGVAISKAVGLVENCPYCITADADGVPVWEEIDGGIKNNHDLDQLHYLLKASNQGTQRGVDFVSCAINDKALQKVTTEQGYAHLWHKLQPYIQVYGRVKPDGKRKVIRFFQDRSTRYVVAMAGDGGNDTGALKQAHVGVALVHGSQSEGTSNVVAPFVATEDDISKTVDILKEGRGCLDTYISCFYLYTLYGLSWIFLGKIYMQSRLAFGNFSQFATLDFFFVIFLPLTLTFQGPRKTLATITPNAAIAKGPSWLYIGIFWLSNAVVFFVLILTMRFPFAEPLKPDLDIRKVEDPMPAWYSPLSLTKEGFWYIGDIAGRSNNPDMALIFMWQCFAVVNIGIACVNGGMRPKGRKLGVITREDGRQTVVRVRDSAAAAGADLEEGRPIMFSSSSSSSNAGGSATESASDRDELASTSTPIASRRTPNQSVPPQPRNLSQLRQRTLLSGSAGRETSGASSRDNLMSSRETSALAKARDTVGEPVTANNGSRQNVGGMLEQIELKPEETACHRFWNHPYKRHWITNPWFVGLVLLIWAFCVMLLFTKGKWWNYVWDVNSFQHQQGGELKDYFQGYHGTMRTMRELREREVDEILTGDGKRVLALPKGKLNGLEISVQTAEGGEGSGSTSEGKSADAARQEKVQKLNEEQAAKHKQQEKQGLSPNEADPYESCKTYGGEILKSNAKTSNVEFAQSFLPSDVGVVTTGQASPYAGYMEGSCAIHVRAAEGRTKATAGQEQPHGGENAGQEQPHGFWQDLGWLGHSRAHTDTAEQARWCEYLCMDAWPYRADRNSFACKFAYPSGNDCYLFQGNVDHFLHVQGMVSAEAGAGVGGGAAAAPETKNGGGKSAKNKSATSFLEEEEEEQDESSSEGLEKEIHLDESTFLEQNTEASKKHTHKPAKQVAQQEAEKVAATPASVDNDNNAAAQQKNQQNKQHARDTPAPTSPGAAAPDAVGQKGAGGGTAGMKDADHAAGEKAAPADVNKLQQTSPGDAKKVVVLDRYNVFGLEKSGYQAHSFVVFLLVVMACHTMCVIGATKGLRK